MKPVTSIYSQSWASLHLCYYYENADEDLVHNYIRSLNVMILRGELKEDSTQTFKLIKNQINNHLDDPLRDSLKIYMCFEELNLRARHYLMEIISRLNYFSRKGNEIIVYWSTKDSALMNPIGEELIKNCDFQFEIVTV